MSEENKSNGASRADEAGEVITRLLRLKRYEQPPEGYFEDFLKEFQHRQRQELLRRPAWRIAWDRMQTRLESLFLPWSFARLSYAGASVAVLLGAGLFTVNLLQHPGESGLGGGFASSSRDSVRNGGYSLAASPVSASGATAASHSPLTLNPQMRMPEVIPAEAVQPTASQHHPRYILDSRPVSYEPPFRF